jgi:alpha-glucoside transport system substrate-binding protein
MNYRGTSLAALAAVGMLLAGCGNSDDSDSASGGGDSKDKTVTVFSSIRDVEADRLEAAWADWEEESGVTIEHEPSAEFETDLQVRVDGNNAPDIALVPQPGLVRTLAEDGSLVEMPADMKTGVEENDIEGWVDLGTVDGKFYGVPFGANIKSLVWYNPKKFAEKGYAVPTTWDEMTTLTEKIAADGGKPWCVGIESGDATGWPLTDWLEDVMLRVNGSEVYDQWVAHEIPFNDPQVADALDQVGDIVKNDKYIQNGVKSIAGTAFADAGLGVVDGSCYMHRQASFYGNQFPEDVTKGADGDVNAFYLPTMKADDPQVMLGGGELIVMFNDDPATIEAAKYLTSAEYANSRVKAGNWLSPNKGLDPTLIDDDLERSFAELLQDSDVFRFDGSDLMPANVGTGSFWTGMTDWVSGDDTQTVLDDIEASWKED